MKLAISSWWFPVCVAKYLLRAAMRAGHEVATVGPSMGDRMAWPGSPEFDGEGVWPNALWTQKFGWGFRDRGRGRSQVLGIAEWCDLWLDVDGGWLLREKLPTRRRVYVNSDPHVASAAAAGDDSGGFARRTPAFCDAGYTMQSNYGWEGAGWLPYAFDPEYHRPDPAQAPEVDICMVGAPYPARDQLAQLFRELGLSVLGPGFGPIGASYAKELRRGRVVVVWPLADDLPCRVFEGLACGRPVVTRGVPDLRRLCPPFDSGGPLPIGPGLWAPEFAPTDIEGFAAGVKMILDMHALEAEAKGFAGERGLCPTQSWDTRLAQLVDRRMEP